MANQNEYGLFQLIDLGLLDPNLQIVTLNSELLSSAINYTLADHNRDIDNILGLFAETTDQFHLLVDQAGVSRSQPVDQNGRALPIKPALPYTIALPLIGSGNAWGANEITRRQMTVRELSLTMNRILRGDVIWLRDQVMAALFTAASYTFTDTIHGNLTVQPLANGDTVTFYKIGTTDANATDNHLLAQAAAISDAANPFPAIYSALVEHPDNQGEVVAFVPTNLVSSIQGLSEFRTALLSPDIRPGANQTVLTGALDLTLPPNARVIGKTDSGVWIVEWRNLPSNYIIGVMTLGRRPLGRRVFPEENLRGFQRFGSRADFPYGEEQWQRWEGFGGLNRVGAVIQRIGNGTYAAPSVLSQPLP